MNFIFDPDTWQEIYGSIRKNKLRASITIIGVMWGIFLLIVLLGAAKGMENNFNKLFGNFATNSVFVWAQSTSMPFKGFQEGKGIRLKLTDADHIMNEIEGLEFVVPRHQNQAQAENKFKVGTFGIYGDYPELDLVEKKDMIKEKKLNELGIYVMRIHDDDVFNNTENVLREIERYIVEYEKTHPRQY